MKMKRNDYLLNQALKLNIFSAIISSVVLNLNSVIDGILMGQLLGPDAFAAINLCSPILFIQGGLAMMVAGGAAILLSPAIGERAQGKVDRIYTAAVILNVLIGAAFVVLAFAGTGAVTGLLCQVDSLRGYVSQYASVMLGCTMVFMFSNLAFKQANVCGTPQIIAVGSVAEIAVNLVCDWLFAGPLGMGVYGAALATVLSALISWLMVVWVIRRKNDIFHLRRMGGQFLAAVKEICVPGVPLLGGTLAMVVFMFLLNTLVQKYCGAEGAFVIALSIQVVNICQAVASGCSTSFIAIGGFMTGQKDYVGTRRLFKKVMLITVVSVSVMCLVIMIGAPWVVRLFGAKTQDIVDYAVTAVRSAILFVIPFTLLMFMPQVYGIAGEPLLIYLTQLPIPIVFGLVITWFGETMLELIWFSFPVSGLILLALSVLATEIVRRRAKEKRCFYSLLPIDEQDRACYDISVACEIDSVREALAELMQFLRDAVPEPGTADAVCHCAEEAMLNFAEHSGRTAQQYMDLRVTVDRTETQLLLKDDGKPFDPTHAPNVHNGLRIMEDKCADIGYSYQYGQNITVMKWPRKDTEDAGAKPV